MILRKTGVIKIIFGFPRKWLQDLYLKMRLYLHYWNQTDLWVPRGSGSVIHCAIAVEEKGKRKQSRRLVSSLGRAQLQMLCGNSLAFILQNRTMDASLLRIICTSFVFNKSVLEKINQNKMNPSWNWLHSITGTQNNRALCSAWLWLVRNLFEKGSTLNYRCINKKGMIPGSVCSSDITIDAF